MGIALLLSVFAIALYNEYTIIHEYQSQLAIQTELVKRVSDLNLDFKIQVQERKNVLLRGHNPEDLDKYWARFNSLESKILSEAKKLVSLLSTDHERKNLNEFIALYPDMMSKYKAGYTTFINNGFSYIEGDQAVRGIDRRPSQLLKQVVVEVEEEARAGESGRGFAVVADEVRKLAQKTQESASQINQTITSLNLNTDKAFNGIQDSLELTSKTTDEFANMIEFLQSIGSSLHDFTQNQNALSEKIYQQIESSGCVTSEASEAVNASRETLTVNEEMEQITSMLHQVTDEIMNVTARFNVDSYQTVKSGDSGSIDLF